VHIKIAYTPHELLWDDDDCKLMKTDVCIEYCNVKYVKCKFVSNCVV
jgi:hypothetical protein